MSQDVGQGFSLQMTGAGEALSRLLIYMDDKVVLIISRGPVSLHMGLSIGLSILRQHDS